MKQLVKQNREGGEAYFDVVTSRKELRSELAAVLPYTDCYNGDGIWADDDMMLAWVDTDGVEHAVSTGDEIPKINVRKVSQLILTNCTSATVYGPVVIEQNEKYGDWDVRFKDLPQ